MKELLKEAEMRRMDQYNIHRQASFRNARRGFPKEEGQDEQNTAKGTDRIIRYSCIVSTYTCYWKITLTFINKDLSTVA